MGVKFEQRGLTPRGREPLNYLVQKNMLKKKKQLKERNKENDINYGFFFYLMEFNFI